MFISRIGIMTAMAMLASVMSAPAQPPPAGAPGGAGQPGGPNFVPEQADSYHSELVQLGGTAAPARLYASVKPAQHARLAVVTSFPVAAAELASRGYRTLAIRYIRPKGALETPFDGFEEISRGIAYARQLPGVERVVVLAWGGGATSMLLYADVAERGVDECQGMQVLNPCTADQVKDLVRPDGLILIDPGLGAGHKVTGVDPAYVGAARSRKELDLFAAANGYDASTGLANYSAEFRQRFYAAQSERNNQAIAAAVARLQALDRIGPQADEPLVDLGAVNTGNITSLHHTDLTILAHTKRPHALLRADGTAPEVIIRSIRETTGPVGAEGIAKAIAQIEHPRDSLTLRQYLANDAIRTTKDFAVTEDDVIGVDWKSTNAGSPAQAEGITIPALVTTNTCFQFVVEAEIVFDHLAAKDKTFAGLEGAEHFLRACQPRFGDTRKRLFDFMDSWLATPHRF